MQKVEYIKLTRIKKVNKEINVINQHPYTKTVLVKVLIKIKVSINKK